MKRNLNNNVGTIYGKLRKSEIWILGGCRGIRVSERSQYIEKLSGIDL